MNSDISLWKYLLCQCMAEYWYLWDMFQWTLDIFRTKLYTHLLSYMWDNYTHVIKTIKKRISHSRWRPGSWHLQLISRQASYQPTFAWQFGTPGNDTVYPKKYAHGFVVLCFVVVMQSLIMNSHEVFIHIHQGCFAGTGAIVRLPQCQWSKPDGYGKISQSITTTKHSKAKTVCIFLGIYCTWILLHTLHICRKKFTYIHICALVPFGVWYMSDDYYMVNVWSWLT